MAEADQREQRAFDMASKQALAMLTTDQAAAHIAQNAEANGAEVALAEALELAGQQVLKAAQGAGVELPPEVIQASQRAVAKVLVTMMAESGLTDDPEGLMAALEDEIMAPVGEEQAPQPPGPPGPPGALAAGAMQ